MSGSCFPIDDDLWLIDRTGDNLTQLTSQPGFEAFPDWSPDGARIAFMRFDDVDDLGDLYLVDADGGNEMLLLPSTPERVHQHARLVTGRRPPGGEQPSTLSSGEVGIVIVAFRQRR